MANHNVKSRATVRETSVEIAEAIFELAGNDEVLAQKIWEEGSDEALEGLCQNHRRSALLGRGNRRAENV